MNRTTLILLALSGMLAASLLLPLSVAVAGWNYVLMFAMGGCFAVLYTVPLVLLGQQFQGADLAAAATVYSIMFSVGSVAGPVIGGIAIEFGGQEAMPLVPAAAAPPPSGQQRRRTTRSRRRW